MMKRSERLKRQGLILDDIMAYKREELPKRQREVPAADLRALSTVAPAAVDFAGALRAEAGVSLIAEIKRASPSKGLLCRDFDPSALAEAYLRGGAAAISVLTDARFFQGQLEYLTEVKEVASAMRTSATARNGRRHPAAVLRKDFIFDPYQILEARTAGADALLLIVAVLSESELVNLLAETRRLGMQALVEVHDEGELERALAADAQVIGVNNRDLRDFSVDLGATERLRPRIPADRVVVSESGIHTADDVRRLRDLGVDAMLVGESLVKAPAHERLVRVQELVAAGRSGL